MLRDNDTFCVVEILGEVIEKMSLYATVALYQIGRKT